MDYTLEEAVSLLSQLDNPSKESVVAILERTSFQSSEALPNAGQPISFFFSGDIGPLGGIYVDDARAVNIINELSQSPALSAEAQSRINFSNTSQRFELTDHPVFEEKLTAALVGDSISFDEFMDGKEVSGIRGLGYFDTLSADFATQSAGDVVAVVPRVNKIMQDRHP